MTAFPIQLNVSGKKCVVVGAGNVAARKAAGLAQCGAHVTVIAPQANADMRTSAASGQLAFIPETYREEHLEGAFLAFAATDNPTVNAQVVRDARRSGILVCDVGTPQSGDFVSPSVVTRGDLVMTVSTGGASPTLAAVVREELEHKYGPEWTALTEIAGRLRAAVKTISNEAARRQAVRRVIKDKRVRELIGQEKLPEAEARARECLFLSSE